MKESEAINPVFNRLSTNQKRMILWIMAIVLMGSTGLSINYRRKIKSMSLNHSLKETSQTIKGIIDGMPLLHSYELDRINHIKKILIQMEILNQKPALSASDSVAFQNMLTELKSLGVHVSKQ